VGEQRSVRKKVHGVIKKLLRAALLLAVVSVGVFGQGRVKKETVPEEETSAANVAGIAFWSLAVFCTPEAWMDISQWYACVFSRVPLD
jgi:hypothetical protein